MAVRSTKSVAQRLCRGWGKAGAQQSRERASNESNDIHQQLRTNERWAAKSSSIQQVCPTY
jgi:hypothetical protein